MAVDPLTDVTDRMLDAGIAADLVYHVIAETRKLWGGAPVYIRQVDRDLRDALALKRLKAGDLPETIAQDLRCSASTIRRLRSRYRQELTNRS
jgi:hypothetical protein